MICHCDLPLSCFVKCSAKHFQTDSLTRKIIYLPQEHFGCVTGRGRGRVCVCALCRSEFEGAQRAEPASLTASVCSGPSTGSLFQMGMSQGKLGPWEGCKGASFLQCLPSHWIAGGSMLSLLLRNLLFLGPFSILCPLWITKMLFFSGK